MYVCMYINKYSVDIYLLCMIKARVRWCTCSLWRMLLLIGLLILLSPPPLYFVFDNSKTKRNDLARTVMGTIFCLCMYTLLCSLHPVGI